MFECVEYMIEIFLDYLPGWFLVFLVLGFVGNIVNRKR